MVSPLVRPGAVPSRLVELDALRGLAALAVVAFHYLDRYPRLTGGEPLLQVDEPLLVALHSAGFEVAIETNGTRLPPPGIDWVCVSPKAGTDLVLRCGDELKLVFPQPGAEPERFAALAFGYFYLQPMDGPAAAENVRLAVEYCMAHPQWRLSLQTHKLLGIR